MADAAADLPYQFGDRAIREALLQPEILRSALHHALGDLADRFDVERREVLPRTFLLDDWREREADLLFRLPFRERDDQAVLVCLLLEHQSKPDPTMPLRALLYAVLYWNQEWQAWHQEHANREPLRLTPVLPLILHTGTHRWTVARCLADLFNCPEALQPWLPQWQLQLWDLAEHSPTELLALPDGWSQLLAVIRAQPLDEADFHKVLAQALQHLEQIGTGQPDTWHQLLRIVLYWCLFQRPHGEHTAVLETVRRSHHHGRTLAEAETMAQQMWVTYEQEVYSRGKSAGEAVGQERGKAEASRNIVRVLLEKKFGELPQDVADRIARASLEQLTAVIPSILDLQKPEDLQLG